MSKKLSKELEEALDIIMEADLEVDYKKREIVLLTEGKSSCDLADWWNAFKILGISNFNGKDGKQKITRTDDAEYIFQCLEYAASEVLKPIINKEIQTVLPEELEAYVDKVFTACAILGIKIVEGLGEETNFVLQYDGQELFRIEEACKFPWKMYEYNS